MEIIKTTADDESLTLQYATDIDLASTKLNFEKFRLLAMNKNITQEERIGFPVSYRSGFEDAILHDICYKLDFFNASNETLLDIGCGASALTYKLLELAAAKDLRVTLVDSQEMLNLIPTAAHIQQVTGSFPDNAAKLHALNSYGFKYILCYSVLHYIFVDTNLFQFLDNLISLLKPGGSALIGDIPNITKRKRFFSSAAGKQYHKNFMDTNQDPKVDFYKIEFDQIDDAVLAAMIQRAQSSGCDAYLLPQANNLPMHNRRDDLLIRKP